MQTIKNRRGLALGAALSMVASLFVGLAPASATVTATTNQIALQPVSGPTTNFNGVIYESFQLEAFLNDGFSSDGFSNSGVSSRTYFEISKVSGALDVLVNTSQTSSGTLTADSVPASASGDVTSISGLVFAASTSAQSLIVKAHGASSLAKLNLRAYSTSALVSSSPSVTLDVKIFIDSLGGQDGEWVAGEWYTTARVVLHNANSIPAVTTLTAVSPTDSVLTVSSTVSTVNWENLAAGKFNLQVMATNNQIESASTGTTPTVSSSVTGTTLTDRAGVVSASFVVSGSNGVIAGTSVSAQLWYSTQSQQANTGFAIGNLATSVAAGSAAATLTVAAVTSSHAVQTGSALVRTNQTVTYRVTAVSNSASISGVSVTVAITGDALSLNSKEISVNGAASTTSYPTALALTTGTDGTATFTLMTSGFVGTENLTITATEGRAVTGNLTVAVRGTVPTLEADYSLLSAAVGTSTPVTFTIEDQWGVASSATNLRLAVTKGGDTGFSYTDTLSYVAVTAGAATFNFAPTPATKTGSATVTAQLQEQQASTGTYINVGSTVLATVNVTPNADSFGAGLASSYSSSVSYFPSSLASAVVVSGAVTNSGSVVTVTGPAGLVFGDATGATASGTLTVRANSSGTYTFDVWATLVGSHTITLTNGAASTTSLIVVDAAANDAGKTITFDTTAIDAGKTRIVTGLVVDMNGNPVDTTAGAGTASILVTFAGTAGIPVGAMPLETNADGEFQVSVLTSSTDRGTFTLTASYLKAGTGTATRDVITVVQSITVGAAVAAPASDQKLTVGSFKGFVAIYALNYTGQKLSAKVAGKWLVVNELTRFQRVVRNTGAGYTIKVDLHIDGVFVRSETVVTK